jgi:hypothetical protein
MARLLNLEPGELQLTEIESQRNSLDSQFGTVTYLVWCGLEADRINENRTGRNKARVYTNGGMKCCVVVDVGRSARS